MILFNWFGVGLIPIVILLAMQIRRMALPDADPDLQPDRLRRRPAHTLPIANMFWLLGSFRPDRAPELTQLLNDLAWLTFTLLVPYLIAQCLLLALAIYLGSPGPQPIFDAMGGGYFNICSSAVALDARGVRCAGSTWAVAWDGAIVLLGARHRDRRLDRRHGIVLRPERPSRTRRRASGGNWVVRMSITDEGPRRDAVTAPDGRRGVASRPGLRHHPKTRAVVLLVGDADLLQHVRLVLRRRHPRACRHRGRTWDTDEQILAFFENHFTAFRIGFGPLDVPHRIRNVCADERLLSRCRSSECRSARCSPIVPRSSVLLAAIPGCLLPAFASVAAALSGRIATHRSW